MRSGQRCCYFGSKSKNFIEIYCVAKYIHYCHESLLVHLSTERRYSGDSYFRGQGFYSNKFTWHFPMDPNACLYYPSQPGVTQTFPQVLLTVQHLLSQ
jgi:hypothetical protein